MLNLKTRTKKIILAAGITCCLAIGYETIAHADGSPLAAHDYLADIAAYTNGTMKAVNDMPAAIMNLMQMSLSLVKQDDSDATAQLQPNLANYMNTSVESRDLQIQKQPIILGDLLGKTVNSSNVDYANDLVYQTQLGSPYYPIKDSGQDVRGDKTPADIEYNYIKYAAGLELPHAVPGNWRGNENDQKNYRNYFNTVTAVETFNAYVLSELYSDNKKRLTEKQKAIMAQVSTSDWFAQIASENIGAVFRQILMFNSQIYVVLSQMLETNKQLLAAVAMNNTLLVLTGQTNEQLLLKKAQQPMPGGS